MHWYRLTADHVDGQCGSKGAVVGAYGSKRTGEAEISKFYFSFQLLPAEQGVRASGG
jgi:hypothetical protein